MNFYIYLHLHFSYFHLICIATNPLGFCFLPILCMMHHIQYVLNHIYCNRHLIKTSYLEHFKICLRLNLNCLYWNFSFLNFQEFKLLCYLVFHLPELLRNLQQRQTLDLKENHLFILSQILLKICFHFVIMILPSF